MIDVTIEDDGSMQIEITDPELAAESGIEPRIDIDFNSREVKIVFPSLDGDETVFTNKSKDRGVYRIDDNGDADQVG